MDHLAGKSNTNKVLLLATITIIIWAIIPGLFSEGMFMDGTYYATLGRNYAFDTTGHQYFPKLSETHYNPFYEHLPMMFWIESLFFKFFGDHYLTERIYVLFTLLVGIVGFYGIWRELKKRIPQLRTEKYNIWLPLLLWLAVPRVSWTYTNNLLECTTTMFSLLAVWLMLLAERNKIWYIASGLMLSAAFLTKGPVAIFVFSFPFFSWVFIHKGKGIVNHLILPYALITIGMIGPIWLLLSDEAFKIPFLHYLDHQLIASLESKRKVVSSRFFILGHLAKQISISVVAVATSWFFRKKTAPISPYVWVFIALGVAGSIPIMLSPKQLSFYTVPAIPFFAIGASVLACNWLDGRIQFRGLEGRKKAINIVSVIILVLSIGATPFLAAKPNRDQELLSDMNVIKSKAGTHFIASIPAYLHHNWGWHGYLYRYLHVSMDKSNEHKFYISDNKKPLEGYELITPQNKKIFIYRKLENI